MWSVGLLVLSLVAHTANPAPVSTVEECLDSKVHTCEDFLEKVKSAASSARGYHSVNATEGVCGVLVKEQVTWQDANETCAKADGMLAWVMRIDPEFYRAMGNVEFWTGLYQQDYVDDGDTTKMRKSYWVYTCPVAGRRGPALNDTSPPDIPWNSKPSVSDRAAAHMTNGGKLADEVPRVQKSFVCQAVLRQPTAPLTTSDQKGLGNATTGGSGSTVLIALVVVFGLALAIACIVLVLYLRRDKKRTKLSKADMPLILGHPDAAAGLSAPEPLPDFSQSPELDAKYWSSSRPDLQTITHSKSIATNDNLALSSIVPQSATFNKLQANVTTPSTRTE